MPFLLSHPQCGTTAYADCICPPVPPGQQPRGHLRDCVMGDVDAAVVCRDPAATGCCTQDHHHGDSANLCPGGHDDPCPHPDDGVNCTAATEAGEPCPGGHCDVKLDSCRVCRPVTIQALPGTVQANVAVPA
jgi:hypothetical protein